MNTHAKVERLDHLGIIAGVISDLKLVEFIDERISENSREEISCGEAVAGMILNGLGFSDRPLTLTPQFFENKALNRLFRPGVKAEHFNRFKLGRALDDCHAYGCDLLFAEVSTKICKAEGVDTKFNSLDTTAFALTGDYDVDSDEHTIEITHGYSKDHRPDLKQAVLEIMCSHDGGVPIISKSWNGNASDTKIFRERAKALEDSFKASKGPHYLIADSKLYDAQTIQEGLGSIPFITRIPSTIKLENTTIDLALQKPFKDWILLDEKHRFQVFDIDHNNLEQRWIVVHSEERQYKAEKSVSAKCEKELEKIEKNLKKLHGEEFSCSCDARKALKDCFKNSKFYEVVESGIEEHKKFESKGRPKPDSPCKLIYCIKGMVRERHAVKQEAIKQSSCFVIGTTIPKNEVDDTSIITAYKNQNNTVEKGFRFLKDPLMFASSLFVKKPERIMGLLMIMTLALLVYAIAQRRLHKALEEFQETIPNQIRKETSRPTLRWIFQLLDGIELVKIYMEKTMYIVVSGLTDLRKRILSYFGSAVMKIYGIDPPSALTHRQCILE
jgi:transposase